MNIERYSEILTKEVEQMQNNQSGLTDFSEGSVIMTILETFARRVEQLYIDTRNGFNTNVKNLAYTVFNFSKKEGTYATGTVIFYRDTAINSVTTIPIGTEIKAGDLTYTTTVAGTIASGEIVSSEISIIASELGSSYNVAAGQVTTISSILPSDVVRVTNPEKITGGVDTESDNDTNLRFIDYINGLDGNNIYALKAAVKSIPGIKDAEVIEHFPPDDSGNNFTLYVSNGGSGLTDEQDEEIKLTVNGNGTEAYPGHKATGIQWDLQSARLEEIDIEYKATCELADESEALTQMNEVIENAVNSLGIGEDLLISDLLAKLKSLTFVNDCSIVSPTENVTINPGYIAHANTITRV